MEITRIQPNVFACLTSNTTANAGFVLTAWGVLIIDTLDGLPRASEMAKGIAAHTARPPLLVINTHWHYDHIFGNQVFGAPVVAHCKLAEQLAAGIGRDLHPEAIAAWVAEHPEDGWLAQEWVPVYPNLIFEQRLVLDLTPVRLVVRHLGGHSPDSSIVDLPDLGVVFAGDLIFEGRVPYLGNAHFAEFIEALQALEALGERVVVPGHGSLTDMAYVSQVREYFQALYARVRESIARGQGKNEVLDSSQLPQWWTDDRPATLRANVGRLYDELAPPP